ncbi:hypothetical protein BKA70DRAFT_1231372 [Coprinopsis sp. MPI-PUGE-AT-0042]|nr:hypothetical protein BKA70DRAFT_1231372 [Coprinopsis sp. MPI-PUGE-AT-0042]
MSIGTEERPLESPEVGKICFKDLQNPSPFRPMKILSVTSWLADPAVLVPFAPNTITGPLISDMPEDWACRLYEKRLLVNSTDFPHIHGGYQSHPSVSETIYGVQTSGPSTGIGSLTVTTTFQVPSRRIQCKDPWHPPSLLITLQDPRQSWVTRAATLLGSYASRPKTTIANIFLSQRLFPPSDNQRQPEVGRRCQHPNATLYRNRQHHRQAHYATVWWHRFVLPQQRFLTPTFIRNAVAASADGSFSCTNGHPQPSLSTDQVVHQRNQICGWKECFEQRIIRRSLLAWHEHIEFGGSEMPQRHPHLLLKFSIIWCPFVSTIGAASFGARGSRELPIYLPVQPSKSHGESYSSACMVANIIFAPKASRTLVVAMTARIMPRMLIHLLLRLAKCQASWGPRARYGAFETFRGKDLAGELSHDRTNIPRPIVAWMRCTLSINAMIPGEQGRQEMGRVWSILGRPGSNLAWTFLTALFLNRWSGLLDSFASSDEARLTDGLDPNVLFKSGDDWMLFVFIETIRAGSHSLHKPQKWIKEIIRSKDCRDERWKSGKKHVQGGATSEIGSLSTFLCSYTTVFITDGTHKGVEVWLNEKAKFRFTTQNLQVDSQESEMVLT